MNLELKELLQDPKEIVRRLDEYVIGQDDAKKALAVMVFHKMVNICSKNNHILLKTPLKKSNVLLIGPTGSGKTQLMQALSDIIKMPITIFDVSGLTSSGYHGGDIPDILRVHIKNCYNYFKENEDIFLEKETLPFPHSNNIDDHLKFLNYYDKKDKILMSLIENGIIYLDEIDKLKRNYNDKGMADVKGDLVQSELLKILESGEVDITNKTGNGILGITSLITDNISIICGGAFSGLDEIIKERVNNVSDSGMGFTNKLPNKLKDESQILTQVANLDLKNYGFKEEFIGRLGLKAVLKPLKKEDLISILKNSKNSVIKEYESLYDALDFDLKIEEEVYEVLAEKALDLKTGARALRSLTHKLFTEQLYNIYNEDYKVVITKNMALERL